MARLDDAEQSARSGVEDEGLDPAESVDFLRNLPALWEAAPNSRRALAESLFESVDVLGLDTMHVEPTPAAVRRGLVEAFSRGTDVYGRGERIRADTPSRSLLIPVTNVPTSASSDAAPRFGQHQAVARAFSRPSRIRSRPYSKSSP
jgi:hypothetical protein